MNKSSFELEKKREILLPNIQSPKLLFQIGENWGKLFFGKAKNTAKRTGS